MRLSNARWLLSILLFCVFPALHAQDPGDEPTAGFNPQRTYLNSGVDAPVPPLGLTGSIQLAAESQADTLTVFQDRLLVAEGGATTRYNLLNAQTGQLAWSIELPGSDRPLDYVPAFRNGVLLVSSPTTADQSAVRAFDLGSGQELWSDSSIGDTTARHPLLLNRQAIFHGTSGVTSTDSSTGAIFWQLDTTTAAAPIAQDGDQVYLLERNRTLRAIDLAGGNTVWSVTNVAGDGSDLLAVAGLVIAADPATGLVTALSSTDGLVLWTRELGVFSDPGLASAYGRLYAFHVDEEGVKVTAINPLTGETIWEKTDSSDGEGGPLFGQVANGAVYFYNSASQRIRVFDATTGTLRWSSTESGVRDLSIAAGLLYVLRDDEIKVYGTSHEIYLAQLADGEGASTLISLVNLGSQTATGTVYFLDDSGNPLPLGIHGLGTGLSTVNFTIEPDSSIRIQTDGSTPVATPGWVRVESDQPLRGTSVFQTSLNGQVAFEAGVGDSIPTGSARVFVTRVTPEGSQPFSTGLALANPVDETANITVRFERRLPTPVTLTADIALAPGEHLAQFLEEIFQGSAGSGVEGTLVIESDIPVVLAALRTQGGFQMSSYPVGIPGR